MWRWLTGEIMRRLRGDMQYALHRHGLDPHHCPLLLCSCCTQCMVAWLVVNLWELCSLTRMPAFEDCYASASTQDQYLQGCVHGLRVKCLLHLLLAYSADMLLHAL